MLPLFGTVTLGTKNCTAPVLYGKVSLGVKFVAPLCFIVKLHFREILVAPLCIMVKLHWGVELSQVGVVMQCSHDRVVSCTKS